MRHELSESADRILICSLFWGKSVDKKTNSEGYIPVLSIYPVYKEQSGKVKVLQELTGEWTEDALLRFFNQTN